nr:hypothetical protein [Tanacetum cinerariifolium]
TASGPARRLLAVLSARHHSFTELDGADHSPQCDLQDLAAADDRHRARQSRHGNHCHAGGPARGQLGTHSLRSIELDRRGRADATGPALAPGALPGRLHLSRDFGQCAEDGGHRGARELYLGLQLFSVQCDQCRRGHRRQRTLVDSQKNARDRQLAVA